MSSRPSVAFLFLDHDRPQEAVKCLRSVKENAQFEYTSFFLDNASLNTYSTEFVREGLVDHLIINHKNNGCGFGTMQLFDMCDADYAFYIQVDQFMVQRIDEIRLGS